MPAYLTHTWLFFTPAEPAANGEFQKRFTKQTAIEWWAKIIIAADRIELAALVNEQIRKSCLAYIESDTGISNVTKVVAFSEDPWEEGQGGQHEATATVDVDQPTSAPWTFKYAAKDYQVWAAIRWIEL